MSEGQRCVECKQWIAKGRSKCSCGGKIQTMDMCVSDRLRRQYQSKSGCCPLPGSSIRQHITVEGGIAEVTTTL